MKEHARIRFNPSTREIEIEGSEEFVKEYYGKIQELMPETPVIAEKKTAMRRTTAEARETTVKKMTNIGHVIALIQGSAEGISTAEIKRETGLAESQIWNIVARATKEGKIKKGRRGLYIGV